VRLLSEDKRLCHFSKQKSDRSGNRMISGGEKHKKTADGFPLPFLKLTS